MQTVRFLKPFLDPGQRVYRAGEEALIGDGMAMALIQQGMAVAGYVPRAGVETATTKRKRETRAC